MNKKPDSRNLRYLQLLSGRFNGRTETGIASDLGFHSPQTLYQRVHRDGFPICPVCGKTPVASGHCKSVSRRRPRRGGVSTKLPPALEGAKKLFPEAVDKLANDVASLGGLEEHLQGERFVAAFVPPRDVPPFYYRSMFPDDAEGREDWEEVCRTYGMPPQQTAGFYPPNVNDSKPVGATQAPSEPLVRVIAAYALLGVSPDELLDAFHPDPALVDTSTRERLEQAVRELMHKAEQLCKLARGGTIRRGPPTEELSPEELETAYWMRRLENDGVSIEKIPAILRKVGIEKFSGRKLSELRNLRIQPPS